MTKYEIVFKESAKKDLKVIERDDGEYVSKILEKIEFCLGEHLFTSIKQCNKKKMGGKENTHRLHVQKRYTIFYTVEKTKEKAFVEVHLIMNYAAAHKRYKRIDL
jgi:addiction module RelE/StbE family toxin